MEFTIGQKSTLPILKLQVVKDGMESYNSMMEFIERSSIFFSMVDTTNGIPKVYTKAAGFVEKLGMDPNASPEYYVYYRFTPEDTNRVGRYEGQFMFINETGTLVLPIREKLFINIMESYVANDLPYVNFNKTNYNCYLTPFPTPDPSQTPYPILSTTPTPTQTNTPTPTITSTSTPTPTITSTSTNTPTPTNTNTPTVTPTITQTQTATVTPTNTQTNTPTSTNTQTPTLTPTMTPTLTPTVGTITITLSGEYSPGSINAKYTATSNVSLPVDLEITFTNTLGVISGSPVVINGAVIISLGQTTGVSYYTIDDDYNILNDTSSYSSVTTDYTGQTSTFVINTNSIFDVTPTPTPTNTQTPTPTNTNTPTQTPTNTQTVTPSVTETPTETPTNTPTASITPTPGSSVTPTPTETPTNTPTSTPSLTPTNTPTETPTQTPTETITQTPTNTPTETPTQTPTPTPTTLPVLEVGVDNFDINQNYIITNVKLNGVIPTYYGGSPFPLAGYPDITYYGLFLSNELNPVIISVDVSGSTFVPGMFVGIYQPNIGGPTEPVTSLIETITFPPKIVDYNEMLLINLNAPNTPTPTPTPTVTPTKTLTSTPTPTLTPTITETPTETPTPTPTPTITETPTVTPTHTPTPTATQTYVTSNLVLFYDPSNPSSYSGSGTQINDLSGNNLNGTMSNISFTSPYFTYNGTNSQITVLDNPLLEPGSGSWTMEVWVNQSVLGNDVVLGKFDPGGGSQDVSYSIRTTNTTYYAQFGSGTGAYINSTNYVGTIGTWSQIVYVFRNGATKNLETFVNGSSIGTVSHSLSGILNTPSNLYIGSYNNGEYAQWFDGKIGIVRLYSKALTSSEVLLNYNNDVTKYIPASPTPTPTVTPTITETPTNTPTPTVTETPTNTPTNTVTPSFTPTNTITPTNTPTTPIGVTFSQTFTQSQAPGTIIENAWTTFRSQLTGTYSNMVLSTSLGSTLTVTDPNVQSIANALRTATTGTNFSVVIGSNTWRVIQGCVSGTADANSIYLTNDGPCGCGGPNKYTIRPMIKNANWGGINGSACGQATQTMTVTFY